MEKPTIDDMEVEASTSSEEEDRISVQAESLLSDLYPKAMYLEQKRWKKWLDALPTAVSQELLDEECHPKIWTIRYMVERGFVGQLLVDDFLRDTLSSLKQPDAAKLYNIEHPEDPTKNPFIERPVFTQSAVETIKRAYENRMEYIIALVSFVEKVYPYIKSKVEREMILEDFVREEIDTFLEIIPQIDRFAIFEEKVRLMKTIFEKFLEEQKKTQE